ncbi:MAG: hypothetical protein AB8G95_20015 [Anaerolineae bacterium]
MLSKETNRKRVWLVIVVITVILLCSAGQYSQGPRATLRRALNLRMLPLSVRIEGYHKDIWTDYIFVASITMNPEDIESLTAGRHFKKSSSPTNYFVFNMLPNYESFSAHEDWSWQAKGNYDDQIFAPHCVIETNEAQDQAFVACLAD